MGRFKVEFKGMEELENKLREMNAINFDAIRKKQATEILNRARATSEPGMGGTPVDTGELRLSSSTYGDEVGYTKDYAPHVEYGYQRKNKPAVMGQRFLQTNIEMQRDIYFQDLKNTIKKG